MLTGIPEPEPFSIYPNPSAGKVTIENKGRFEYRVIDVTGKEILTGTGKDSVSISLPKGVFFVAAGSTIRKLIVL